MFITVSFIVTPKWNQANVCQTGEYINKMHISLRWNTFWQKNVTEY